MRKAQVAHEHLLRAEGKFACQMSSLCQKGFGLSTFFISFLQRMAEIQCRQFQVGASCCLHHVYVLYSIHSLHTTISWREYTQNFSTFFRGIPLEVSDALSCALTQITAVSRARIRSPWNTQSILLITDASVAYSWATIYIMPAVCSR